MSYIRSNNLRTILVHTACSVLLTALGLFLLQPVTAQVRSSTNYQLQSDSLNAGGGLSSSTNYTQESTVGEIATGRSASASYSLRAGYQQMQEVYLSLVPPANVVMDTSIPGITGGTSNGTTTAVVTTDSPAGYRMTIQSESEPAMQSNVGSIADYEEGAEPDFAFSVGAGQAYFGFSPSGVDIPSLFRDNGVACNTGGFDTDQACWAGLSTSTITIAETTNANHPNGATTTIQFRVGVGSGANLINGVYTATTTVTALPL